MSEAARCWGIAEFPLPRGPALQRELILCKDLQPLDAPGFAAALRAAVSSV